MRQQLQETKKEIFFSRNSRDIFSRNSEGALGSFCG